MMIQEDPVELIYEESLLRMSDVELLRGPHWLNDNIISFYFEYLRTRNHHHRIQYVPAEVTQCVKLSSPSQIGIFLEPLDSPVRRYFFFALNDNERAAHAGGSHWSLLVFSKDNSKAHHYDSSPGSNEYSARVLSKKLFGYFRRSNGQMVEEVTAHQHNGYDCGIHLLCNAECLSKHLARGLEIEDYQRLCEDVRNSVPNKRKDVLNIIATLKYTSRSLGRP